MSAPIVERISYGNLRPPRRPGVLGLGMAASVCGGIAAIVVVVMLMFAGILAALVTLVVLTLVLLPLVIHGRDGHTGYEKILAATLFRRADRAGKTKYVSGVTGQTPDGCTRLPGLLAATELVSGTDVYGEEFGVLITPAIEHYAIVFQTEATGAEMVNQSVTDNEVAHHGGWLAQLSQEADVVAAAVTVETAPDPGTRLVRMMNRHRQDDAPEFSVATMDEIAQKYPVASSSITTRVAVTFNGKPRAGEQARSRADMLDYLARRLPGFRAGLTTTGAGLDPTNRLTGPGGPPPRAVCARARGSPVPRRSAASRVRQRAAPRRAPRCRLRRPGQGVRRRVPASGTRSRVHQNIGECNFWHGWAAPRLAFRRSRSARPR